MRLDPNVAVLYANLSRAYGGLGRFEEAKAILEEQIAKKLDGMFTHVDLYGIAFIQGDAAAMQRQVEWAKGKPNEFNMVATQAAAAALSGKLQQSRELRRRAAELAKSRNFLEPAANITRSESTRLNSSHIQKSRMPSSA